MILLWIILLTIVISLLLRFTRSTFVNNPYDCNLEANGFQIINALTPHEVDKIKGLEYNQINEFIKNSNVHSNVSNIIGPGYELMDYTWIIEKASIHTCHRDSNGDLFNELSHPSYTLIIYIDEMDRSIEVVDGSHRRFQSMFLTDPTKSIKCKPGEAILFNSNLLHAGSINKKPNNLRIQLKFTHSDDMQKLEKFNNFHKVMNKTPIKSNIVKRFQKHLTCQCPLFDRGAQKSYYMKRSNPTPLRVMFWNMLGINPTLYKHYGAQDI